MALSSLPETAQHDAEAGGSLLLESAGDGYSYHVHVIDRESGKLAHVQVEGDVLIDLLELVGRIVLGVIQSEDLDEERDSMDPSDLEYGNELYVGYTAGDDETPEGLMIESIETGADDSHVILALAELPQLQMHLSTLLMSGLHR